MTSKIGQGHWFSMVTFPRSNGYSVLGGLKEVYMTGTNIKGDSVDLKAEGSKRWQKGCNGRKYS